LMMLVWLDWCAWWPLRGAWLVFSVQY